MDNLITESKPAVELGVKRITLLGWNVAERPFEEGKYEFDFSITQNTSFDTVNEMAAFIITFTYKNKATEELLISFTVLNMYHLKGLKAFGKEVNGQIEILLPRDVLVTCLSLSLSHCRAILSQNITNTIYSTVIPLPVFNPVEVANVLYPVGKASERILT